jgi:hypothetical protein
MKYVIEITSRGMMNIPSFRTIGSGTLSCSTGQTCRISYLLPEPYTSISKVKCAMKFTFRMPQLQHMQKQEELT